MRRGLPVVLLAVAVALGVSAAGATGRATRLGGDWTRFGYDAARHNAGPAKTGITSANVGKLRRQRVTLDGTVDASPIYLRGVKIHGASRDAFFVTTSYGRTIAVDAASGSILWRFTPSSYSSLAGTYRITNSTPVADPNRKFIYAASPDGRVHKLSVASGAEARGWPVRVTLLPQREKLGTSLNYARGLVLIGTGGYVGDQPPIRATSSRSTLRPAASLTSGTPSARTSIGCSTLRAARTATRRSGPGRASSWCLDRGTCSWRPATEPSTASATGATAP